MCTLNIFSSCSLDVDNVSENGSPSENPDHASSHLLPNTSLIPKTLNRSSNSVNSHTSVPVFTVQSPTHTSASPVQSPSHVTPSITSPVKPTFTHSSVSPVQSPSHSSSITSPVKPTIRTSSSVSPVQSPSHTLSVTSPVKPSTHSSESPACCEPPLATDSALTTSNHHVNVREAADKEYRKDEDPVCQA